MPGLFYAYLLCSGLNAASRTTTTTRLYSSPDLGLNLIDESGGSGQLISLHCSPNQAEFFFSPMSPFYIGDLPNVEPTISAHSYFSVWPLDKQVEYRQLLGRSLQAANPDLGYWQSEYCILQRNGEIGRGGGRRTDRLTSSASP